MDTSQLEIISDTSSDPQTRVGFVSIQQISFQVSENGVGFFEWVRHTLILYLSKHKTVHGFIIELTLPLYLALEYLIVVGSTFTQVIDQVTIIERACIEKYGEGGKNPCHQYSVIGIFPMCRGSLKRDQHNLQTISFVQVAYKVIGGSQINSDGRSG